MDTLPLKSLRIIRRAAVWQGLKSRIRLVALCLSFVSVALIADEPVSKAYKIKAAYLYQFTKFVDWPTNAFATADAPLIIGVFGTNPFKGELAAAVEGRNVNRRKIEVREVEKPGDLEAVHLLFIPESEDHRVGVLISTLEGASVLTVGETSRFLEAGGIIRFIQKEGKIRFEIGSYSWRDSRLKISAQLQKLATNSPNN